MRWMALMFRYQLCGTQRGIERGAPGISPIIAGAAAAGIDVDRGETVVSPVFSL